MITGQYNEHGYTIFQDGRQVYTAGNSRVDSQAQEHPGSNTVPLVTLKRYCRQTAGDIAEELKDTVGEIDYCPE